MKSRTQTELQMYQNSNISLLFACVKGWLVVCAHEIVSVLQVPYEFSFYPHGFASCEVALTVMQM